MNDGRKIYKALRVKTLKIHNSRPAKESKSEIL